MNAAKSEIAGLILAGGQATRFGGGPKGAALLKGRPLAAYVADTLAGSAAPVAINTIPAFAASYGELNLPIVFDATEFADRGPLVGVLAGLEWAKALGAKRLLTSPCDTPFLPPELGLQLLGALEPPLDAAIAVTSEGEHPLCAAWNVALAPRLRVYLSNPDAKLAVKAFLATLLTGQVTFANEADFSNLNTREELQAGEARLA